jgi:hypothetical protein
LAAVSNASSEQLLSHERNESHLFNQRKWLEVIVDFVLNIKENKNATKNEFLKTFSYTQVHSNKTLEFLYDIFNTNTNLMPYFLANVQINGQKLGISKYLIDYLNKNQTEFFNVSVASFNENFRLRIPAAGLYIRNQLKLKAEFDITHNKAINSLTKTLLDRYINLSMITPTPPPEDSSRSSEISDDQIYLAELVECLLDLYDEESLFYDDESILDNLLKLLSKRFLDTYEKSTNGSVYYGRTIWPSLVSLTCIAYKSNLIDNEFLIKVYYSLIKASIFFSV